MARHSRMNTDVKPARKLDIENASKDELIEYLCQTIHYEVEKGEDADCDLIRECSDWLDELTADLIVFTPEELEAKLEALKSGKDVPISNQHKPHPTTSAPRIKSKVFARVGILVATIMLLSLLSLSVMAKHAGYDSAWEYISENVAKLFCLNHGDEINEDGITIIKHAETIKYNNMEDLLKGESLNILYPHVMPNGVKISSVHLIQETSEKYMLFFTFSSNQYVFNITNYSTLNSADYNGFDCVTINNMNFYIKKINDELYYASLIWDGIEYTIQSPNYDDLITIISNTKG